MVLNQIKKLEKEIEKLKEAAYKDELTGLYNRRGFKSEAEKFLKEIAAFKKYPNKRESFLVKNFGLILFDIDNFKKFNDNYGHQAGDEVLKKMAKVVLGRIRDIDLAARWGGEEIIVGLVGADEKDAFNVAEDIRQRLAEEKILWNGRKLRFTVSAGAADFDGKKKLKSFDDLFELADKALYAAKEKGKNQVVKSSDLS
ncbi:GGDEF domain-containing protein [Candidatus Wolfebacteria bacterium]|nr:GGDEF domain-containing protein [Candidatus Wolfebacteria bacterium]